MTAPYRLFGAELSPFSIKARWALGYKGVAFEWKPRSAANQAEFTRYAKLPLIPVLVGADEEVLQDSTPMLEILDQRYPAPALLPADPALAFLAQLIEDFADEWVNKAMFHYRWSYEADQLFAAKRIVDTMLEGQEVEDRRPYEAQVRERMVERRHFVGSSEETAPVIESAFRRLVEVLQTHLMARPYLFGAAPCLADFGLAAQMAQLLSDPTPGGVIRAHGPHVEAWIARVAEAKPEGEFETLESLSPTLLPLLRDEVGAIYLPWMEANAEAVRADQQSFTISLGGLAFQQSPQRYAAKAFLEIRRKRALAAENAALAALLEAAACDAILAAPRGGETAPQRDEADDGGDDDGEGGED